MVIRGTSWTSMAHWRWDVTLGSTTFRIFMAALICPPSLAIKSCRQIQKKKTSSHLWQTLPDALPLSSRLALIELSCFPGWKAISGSAGLWNEPPFESIFGKCTKEPLRKFMVHQTPRLERPHRDWDTTTDVCVPLSLDSPVLAFTAGACIFIHQNDSTTGF